jgi:hypothetical protein
MVGMTYRQTEYTCRLLGEALAKQNPDGRCSDKLCALADARV